MARISIGRLSQLCHRVAESYKAGIDLRTIWQRESKQVGTPRYQQAIGKVAQQVGDGVGLGTAMASTDRFFPDLTVAVATAGEQSGRLERAFFLLRDHYKTLTQFRKKVLLSISWPLFELGMTILIIGGLMWVMDFVVGLTGAPPIDWLGFGWNTSQYFALYLFMVTTVFGSIAAVVIGIVRGWFGRAPMKLAKRIPVVGKIIENLALSQFCWALSVVSEAGINIKEGVRLALRATDNFYYQDLEEDVFKSLETGKDLTDSLTATDTFPNELLMYVENGELTGNLPESLLKLADDYLERVENGFKILATILFFVCFLIIGVVILIAIILLFKAVILDPTQNMMREFGV